MWTTILGFAGKLFGDMITGWFKAEKTVEADWKAKTYEGKMKSYRTSSTVEKKISESEPVEIPTDANAWNQGAGRAAGMILLLLSLSMLSGCSIFTRYVNVHDRKPVIELPDRPELDEEPPFTEREKKLVGYSVNLETRITTYNDWATNQNIENEYEDGEEETDRDGSSEPE